MHLVFLNQYYPPDAAPTGVMLEAVAERLVAEGQSVTVLCAAGGYADGEKLKAEMPEHGRKDGTNALLIKNPSPRILRIRATKLGRGTFVGKLLDYASFYAGVAWKLLTMHPRPDRIVALTTPPYLSVLARVISKFRGADHAHWVMDLYPDVMAAHGMLNERGVVYRLLTWLARFGFGGGRCVAVLTLGPDMAERVRKVIGHRSSVIGKEEENCAPDSSSHSKFKIHWVPLWSGAGDPGEVDGMAVANRRHEMGWADDELVVMYSGNMGLGHRFSEILEVIGQRAGDRGQGTEVGLVTAVYDRRSECEASAISHSMGIDAHRAPLQSAQEPVSDRRPKTRFVFFGGGKRREEIRDFIRKHPGGLVELHDYVAAEMLGPHLRSADVHLVSLDAGWTGTMVPSKLQGIFEAERPVVFIGSSDSSIGCWVRESGGGWVVEPGDVAALADAIEEAGNPQERALRGHAARLFAGRYFDKMTNVARVAEVLGGSTKA